MKKGRVSRLIIFFVLLVVFIASVLVACKPPEKSDANFVVIDGPENSKYKELTTRDEAIDRATGALDNLLDYLDSTTVSDAGYFVGADLIVNTEDGSAFRLRLRANLYTYPYEDFEEGTPEYEAALNKHNELIKKNDLILEWYDGATNTMLIGFYFDGINPGSPDPGNNLYLNLQGNKRIHPNFGDTVLYQQMIRLITKFNLDSVLASTTQDGTSDDAIGILGDTLKMAVVDNYVVTQNREVGSIYFHDLALSPFADKITGFIQNIFAPFGDKVDPLTYKYLGFMFSTLGRARFTTINADMRFLVEPNEILGKEILTGIVLDARGDSSVKKFNKALQREEDVIVPFTTTIAVNYSVRVATDLVFDKSNYVLYDYGNYEFTGDMYMPQLDLKLDVLLRTDVNKYDNLINRVFMQCRELGTDNTVIGLYYTAEFYEAIMEKAGKPPDNKEAYTFLDIKGITELYGGIHFEDIGLPQAYRGGFDLAKTLMWLSDFIDTYIVIAVDNILEGNKSDEESKFGEVTRIIMNNVESHMKDEEDPASRATIRVRIDMKMIREVMTATSKTGTTFTNEQLIQMINHQFNIDIEAIAAILGVSVDELVERSYFDITYDVDYSSIKFEVYSAAEKPRGAPADLYLRMNLYPEKIGEYVPINFGDLSNFNEMQDVMTYSGKLNGQFIFANDEIVDMSGLLGAFMGDKSGLNTPYILPYQAKVEFELYYDQYIREQILSNGRWTRRGRSAFDLRFNVVEGDQRTTVLRIYGNDVSFNSGFPIEEHGYVWLDYVCIPNLPKFKVREDLFLTSFYEYMGYDFENENPEVVLGLTDILQALMEDSWVVYEPEVIRITTSNQTVKKFFGVDKMIATFDVSVRFIQQVFGVDQLSSEFAMYTVGNLSDITGPSVYSIKLHDTIKVYFDFGDSFEERDLYFVHAPESIELVPGREFYRPATEDRFMGVTRDYLVRVTDRIGRQPVVEMVEKRQEWEPLLPTPTTGAAYYGSEGSTYNYNVDYLLHAAYDRNTGYYTVISDYNYENIYDHVNKAYVLSLGAELNFKKAYEELGDVKTYLREETLLNDIRIRYEFNSKVAGAYVVTHIGNDVVPGRVLYLKDYNKYVSFNSEASILIKARDHLAKVYEPMIETNNGIPFYFDLKTGLYYANVKVVMGAGQPDKYFKIRYDLDTDTFNVARSVSSDELQKIRNALEHQRIVYSDEIDWDGADFSHITFNTLDENLYDWNNEVFGNFIWEKTKWEEMTLEGGLYIVKATIGRGMMATYVENIEVKVINRTIDTDKYVLINTKNHGQVQAPVAAGIEIDPYVYLIYKSYYVNVLGGLPTDFTTWFFEKYLVTFVFTKIYIDAPEEDTPDEVARFNWYFDKIDGNEVYTEEQINNRNKVANILQKTYVYTVFHNQVIALELRVPYRTLKEFYVPGEDEPNKYTVDALDPATYNIPKKLKYVFSGTTLDENGQIVLDIDDNPIIEDFILDFNNIPESTIFKNLQEFMPRFSTLPKAIGGLDLIKWANPKATNVKLINDYVDGHVKPFVEIDSNLTSSFIDFLNCFDKNLHWYYDDWFHVLTVTVEVDIPDKQVSTFNRDVCGFNHFISSEEHYNIQIQDYYNASDNTNATWGYFAVDPYDESTWTLPRDIYVHFDTDVPDVYTRRAYSVNWENLEGDFNDYFIENEDGYYIKDISKMPSFFRLRSYIGDITTENNIKFEIIVLNRSGYIEEVKFLDSQGEEIEGIQVDSTYKSDIEDYTSQATAYRYDVNTYKRFIMPSNIEITFRDGDIRTYSVIKWGKNNSESAAMEENDPAKYRLLALDPWNPNKTFRAVATVIGQAIKEKVFLIFVTDPRTPQTITINNKNDNFADVNIDIGTVSNAIAGTDILVSGIRIDENGKVLNIVDGNAFFVEGRSVNIYGYIKHLFANITVKYGDETTVNILDAATSADDKLYAEIDLQEILANGGLLGQEIKIYLGQGSMAHDLNVTVKVNIYNESNEYDWAQMEQEDYYIITKEIEAFTPDNLPKYPNGYVFKDQLNFAIRYKDGTVITYGNGADDVALPSEWSVVMSPIGAEDGGLETMMGYYSIDDYKFDIYDKITMLDTETIYSGGWLWVTTLLPDGSRVYVRYESIGIEIGSAYDSVDPTSRYAISQGVLTIDNLYAHYPLGNNLLATRLPTVVRLSNGLQISDLRWTITMPAAKLNSINYLGNMTDTQEERAFATTRIMRENVTLYLNVLPTVVNQIRYGTVAENGTKSFISNIKDADGIIKLEFDIYQNIDYNGKFVLPTILSFKYAGRDAGEYQHLNLAYEYRGIGYTYSKSDPIRTASSIMYNLSGITGLDDVPINSEHPDYVLLQTEREILLNITLKDGQLVKFLIHINNKTIDEYLFENLPETVDKTLTINPYSAYTTVPSKVTIKFVEGPDYVFNANWIAPAIYNGFFFNTYRESINTPENNNQTSYKFEATLPAKGTVSAQSMTLFVTSLNYIIDTWSFKPGQEESYIANAGEQTNPNTHYLFNNPFEEKISVLPTQILNPYFGIYASAPEYLPVFWEIVEEDVNAEGTITKVGDNYVHTPKVIKGRVFNANGQPLGLKISVARWDFHEIQQLQGGNFEPMVPAEFLFNEMTNKSAHKQYRIGFKVRSYSNPNSATTEYRIFIPEDEDPTKVTNLSTGVKYQANHAYRLVWDSLALENAKATPTQGRFYLANNDLAIKFTADNATYAYAKPNVTEIDLGFGMGVENSAIFVVNPIAPVFNYSNSGSLVIPIQAKGRIGLDSNVLFNNHPDFIIEAVWAPEGGSAPIIPEGLLGGGVDRNFPITIRIRKHSDPSYTLTQSFRIMLVALDMSPKQTINILNHNLLNRASVTTLYNESTYLDLPNPYLESYQEIMQSRVTRHEKTDNALNIALIDNNLIGKLYDYEVLEWDGTEIVEGGMRTIKSRRIKILQRTYNSDIVRRVVSVDYKIETLDLGFGAGMDAVQYNLETAAGDAPEFSKTTFVVNPLAPTFTRAGALVGSSANVVALDSTKIVIKDSSNVPLDDTHTYQVVFWDANSGDTSILPIRKYMLEGGIVDEWKIRVEVIKGANVVATLIYNIQLVFLDMRPQNNTILYYTDDSISSLVNTNYGEDRYGETTNPYGASYANLRVHLNSVASDISTIEYIYEATAWSSEVYQDGLGNLYRESITVKVNFSGQDEEFITVNPVLRRHEP